MQGQVTGMGSLRRVHLICAELSDFRSTFAAGDGPKRVAALACNALILLTYAGLPRPHRQPKDHGEQADRRLGRVSRDTAGVAILNGYVGCVPGAMLLT